MKDREYDGLPIKEEIHFYIEKLKLWCPDGFQVIKEMEELLDDAIIIPKSNVKMSKFTFDEKDTEYAPAKLMYITGTLSFSSICTFDKTIPNPAYLKNAMKEQIRESIIDYMENYHKEDKNE